MRECYCKNGSFTFTDYSVAFINPKFNRTFFCILDCIFNKVSKYLSNGIIVTGYVIVFCIINQFELQTF